MEITEGLHKQVYGKCYPDYEGPSIYRHITRGWLARLEVGSGKRYSNHQLSTHPFLYARTIFLCRVFGSTRSAVKSRRSSSTPTDATRTPICQPLQPKITPPTRELEPLEIEGPILSFAFNLAVDTIPIIFWVRNIVLNLPQKWVTSGRV